MSQQHPSNNLVMRKSEVIFRMALLKVVRPNKPLKPNILRPITYGLLSLIPLSCTLHLFTTHFLTVQTVRHSPPIQP
ncbi:hypothetical protein BT69DRAFT_1276207 [Atractiella rhizophila]|nr:hypothetical protein BT69DRAFT_1276207 [Atractiella rhizophila]